jgi:hypothetical protein
MAKSLVNVIPIRPLDLLPRPPSALGGRVEKLRYAFGSDSSLAPRKCGTNHSRMEIPIIHVRLTIIFFFFYCSTAWGIHSCRNVEAREESNDYHPGMSSLDRLGLLSGNQLSRIPWAGRQFPTLALSISAGFPKDSFYMYQSEWDAQARASH